MLKKIIISLMLAFLFTTILSAGTTGKLAGKVTDEKGNPIPFANITIMDGETLVSGMMTKENGSYFIINITPGVYDVFCMRGGFRTQKRSGVKISLDLTQIENFKNGKHFEISETCKHNHIRRLSSDTAG